MTKEVIDTELTPEEKAFADAHGFYDAEAKEWLTELEKVYGKGKVPVNIDLGYEVGNNGQKIAMFDGPDGQEHRFVSKVDAKVCEFAEAHGFDYKEAEIWYAQMEKVYGKGKVPAAASLEYEINSEGKGICRFDGPDGKTHEFFETMHQSDVHNELAAQRKVHDLKEGKSVEGDDRLDAVIQAHQQAKKEENAATVVRQPESRDR